MSQNLADRYASLGALSPVYAKGSVTVIATERPITTTTLKTLAGMPAITEGDIAEERRKLGKAARENLTVDQYMVGHMITTTSIDRCNDIVDPAGCSLRNYLINPIVLYGHCSYDYRAFIGHGHNLQIAASGISSDTRYHGMTGDLSLDIAALSIAGLMPMVSIGFIGLQWEDVTLTDEQRASGQYYPSTNSIRTWKKWELLEYSNCLIPMNPTAGERKSLEDTFVMAKEFGIVRSDGAMANWLIEASNIYVPPIVTEKNLPANAALEKQGLLRRRGYNTNPRQKLQQHGNTSKTEGKIMEQSIEELLGALAAAAKPIQGALLDDGDPEAYKVAAISSLEQVAMINRTFCRAVMATTEDPELIAITKPIAKAADAALAAIEAVGVEIEEPEDEAETPEDMPPEDAPKSYKAGFRAGYQRAIEKVGAALSTENLNTIKTALGHIAQGHKTLKGLLGKKPMPEDEKPKDADVPQKKKIPLEAWLAQQQKN